jgi:hypothetical protein
VLLLALLCLAPAAKAQWMTIQLQGRYDDTEGGDIPYPWHRWRFGRGDVAYSFALQKTLPGNGDITMVASMPARNQVLVGVLNDGASDLGALPQPPKAVGRVHLDCVLDMVVGHYYYIQKGNAHAVIQLLEIKASPTEVVKTTKGFFGGVYYASDVEASFRVAFSGVSLDDLNNRLKEGGSPTPAGQHPSVPRIMSPPSTEAGPLAAAYEQFQNDAKAFLDLPTEQATVPKCDVLLETAKNLITRINDQIGEVDSTITGNGAKVSSLNERLAKITDLQLKDRTQTRISKIKEETERLQKDLKEWTAKLDELQKTEKKLREYRLIIGI